MKTIIIILFFTLSSFGQSAIVVGGNANETIGAPYIILHSVDNKTTPKVDSLVIDSPTKPPVKKPVKKKVSLRKL